MSAGKRNPEDRERRDGETRRHPQPRSNRFRGAPDEDGGQRQHEYPARDRSGHSRKRVHHEVYDDAPDRRSDDETLRERNAVVRLAQRDAHDDVADGGERGELGEQEQQPREYGRINCHRPGLTNASRAAAGRRLRAEPG